LRNARSIFSTVCRTLSGTLCTYTLAVVAALACRNCSWMSRSVPPLACARVANPRRKDSRIAGRHRAAHCLLFIYQKFDRLFRLNRQ
jgi:hypothetical protein